MKPMKSKQKKSNKYSEAEAIVHYRENPVRYIQHIFGVTPTLQQQEALNAMAVPGAHVTISSGHGTGKSTLFVWSILMTLDLYNNCKIPITAPTAHQLYDIIWPELSVWRDRMPNGLRQQFEIQSGRAHHIHDPNKRFSVPRTARPENPDALQGFHAEHLLYLIDEAPGVHNKIFETAEGALSTRGARVAMAGNPTQTSGYFYDSHHKDRHHWTPLHFSCLDAPNPPVDPAYAIRMKAKYGELSDIYRVRVLGDFPDQAEDQLIALELLESASIRDVPEGGGIVWGLDPARYGDDETVLCVRKGDIIERFYSTSQKSTMEVAGWVIALWETCRSFEKPERIYVDSIGIGAGVYDRLKELGIPAGGINVSESPGNKRKYPRLRDELWCKLRDWLGERRGRIPADEKFIGQASSIKYSFDSSGKIKVEKKEDMKKRGLESPDYADAACLTFAGPARRTDAKDAWWIKPQQRRTAIH